MKTPINTRRVMRRVETHAVIDDNEDRVIRCTEPEGLEVWFAYAGDATGGTWVKMTEETRVGNVVSADTVEGEIRECDPDVAMLKYSNSLFAEVAEDRAVDPDYDEGK